ncbi:hypothetical protein, partial [Hydrogenimonas sp.]
MTCFKGTAIALAAYLLTGVISMNAQDRDESTSGQNQTKEVVGGAPEGAPPPPPPGAVPPPPPGAVPPPPPGAVPPPPPGAVPPPPPGA